MEKTIEDVRRAYGAYRLKHGTEAGIALIREFGAQTLADLQPGQYADFIQRCGADAKPKAHAPQAKAQVRPLVGRDGEIDAGAVYAKWNQK